MATDVSGGEIGGEESERSMMRNGVRRLVASVKKRSMGFVVTVRNSMLM